MSLPLHTDALLILLIRAELLVGLSGFSPELKEPFLSPCLLLARAFVHAVATTFPPDLTKAVSLSQSSIAYNLLGYRNIGIIPHYLRMNPIKFKTINPLGPLVPLLRQELVVTTLLATRLTHNDALHYSRSIAAVQRLLKLLRESHPTLEGDLKCRTLVKIHDVEEILLEYQERNEGGLYFGKGEKS